VHWKIFLRKRVLHRTVVNLGSQTYCTHCVLNPTVLTASLSWPWATPKNWCRVNWVNIWCSGHKYHTFIVDFKRASSMTCLFQAVCSGSKHPYGTEQRLILRLQLMDKVLTWLAWMAPKIQPKEGQRWELHLWKDSMKSERLVLGNSEESQDFNLRLETALTDPSPAWWLVF